jgi:hypothetical protein
MLLPLFVWSHHAMRARIVDWSLLAIVFVGIVTGLWSFLMGDPVGHWLFVAHGALGLATLGVLALKIRRVTPVVLSPKGRRISTVAGILTALAALATVGIGLWWVVMQSPVVYPNGMILHTTAAFVLLGLALWHLLLRYRPLTGRDLRDRRSSLRLLAILVGAGVLWAGVESAQRAAGSAGSQRRFTGSRKEEGPFPVTMWMFDNPMPVQLQEYTLDVAGAVKTTLRLTMAELGTFPQHTIQATIDCTGGWYSEQRWSGIGVADLLARAQLEEGTHYVRFRSLTGYRWSLPLDEARATLLATHVGGAPLDHGHGAPLRLVAPGRRGFQWVKWVVAVDVLRTPDVGQWGAIFTSGLDRT